MAKEKSSLGKVSKLPPIPQGSKISKRPVMKRQPPGSASTRIIYISSSTPFMSAVKRVRKKLDASLRAATAPDTKAAPRNASLQWRIEGLRQDVARAEQQRTSADGTGDGEGGGGVGVGEGRVQPVLVMGTGRAVEKVLGLAGWFGQEGDCVVGIRTRTVGTVDDVVVAGGGEEGDEGDEEDGSRVRKMSCLEVSIRLK